MRCLLLFVPALLLVAQTTPTAKKMPGHTAPAAIKNFKETGSPNAPITIELYTDYQCPHCREFYLDTLPPLTAEFIKTGKVRLLHRDFPLPQFQYSRLATRFANAAGQIGKYDVVAKQLFETQPEWARSGDVEGAVAKVLSPAEMQKVHDIVQSDSHLDDSVARDVAMGMQDHLSATPTIVIVTRDGKREVISGGMSFPLLKSYLDKRLAE